MTWSVATPRCVAPSSSMPNTDCTTARVPPTSTPVRVEVPGPRREVLPEELVGAVDEMHAHGTTLSRGCD